MKKHPEEARDEALSVLKRVLDSYTNNQGRGIGTGALAQARMLVAKYEAETTDNETPTN